MHIQRKYYSSLLVWRLPQLLLGLLMVSLMSGCLGRGQGLGQGQAFEAETRPLRVEWTIWHGDYTLLVAQELGLFEKYGVAVEPVFYENFSNAIPDLAAGRIDIGLFGMIDTLNVATRTDVVGIAVYDSGGITSVMANAEIAAPQDLRGKRIGVPLGMSAEMVIRDTLQRAGLTVKDVVLVNVPYDQIPAQLSDNSIQAGVTYEPHTSQALAAGHRSLTSSEVSSLLPDIILARQTVVQARPEDIRAFLDAWFEAVEYRLAEPEKSAAIISQVTGIPADELLSGDAELYNLADNRRIYTDLTEGELLSIYQIAQFNIDFLVSTGSLTQLIDLRSLFDPSFLPSDVTTMLWR